MWNTTQTQEIDCDRHWHWTTCKAIPIFVCVSHYLSIAKPIRYLAIHLGNYEKIKGMEWYFKKLNVRLPFFSFCKIRLKPISQGNAKHRKKLEWPKCSWLWVLAAGFFWQIELKRCACEPANPRPPGYAKPKAWRGRGNSQW